jgi:hypothetical protein
MRFLIMNPLMVMCGRDGYSSMSVSEPFLPGASPGEIHEDQEEGSEDEDIEVDVIAADEEQAEPEDTRDLSKDHGHYRGTLEPKEGGLGVLPLGFPEEPGTKKADEDDDGDGSPEDGVTELRDVGECDEAAKRPVHRPQDFNEAQIDEEAGDDRGRDQRYGFEMDSELVLDIHVDLLA